MLELYKNLSRWAIVYTNHVAVKARAVLENPNLNGKHAHWWSRVHGSGCLSRQLNLPPRHLPQMKIVMKKCKYVTPITSENDSRTISTLPNQCLTAVGTNGKDFADEQCDNEMLQPIILYLEEDKLSEDLKLAQKIIPISKHHCTYAATTIGTLVFCRGEVQRNSLLNSFHGILS